MENYYVTIEDGEVFTDAVAEMLVDDDAALLFADRSALDLSRNTVRPSPWYVVIHSELGKEVARVAMAHRVQLPANQAQF